MGPPSAESGDLNDDGVADIVIGAYEASPGGRLQAGASYVIFGSRTVSGDGLLELSTLNGTNGFVINGVAAGDQSGIAVSGAGDFNADGIADLLIGAYTASPGGRTNAGASYVVFGHHQIGGNGTLELSSLNGTNGFALLGVSSEDLTGFAVSGVGDINSDGIADLVIGAYGAMTHTGASYVVFGSHTIQNNGTLELSNLNGTNGFVINGVTRGDWSGFSVSGAGDLNADGVADLAIGAYGASPDGRSQAGTSYVVFGRHALGGNGTLALSGLNGVDGFTLWGAVAGGNCAQLGKAGDVNADGIADLLIGAVDASPEGRGNAGTNYVVFGHRQVGGNGTLDLSNLNGTNGFAINGVAAGDYSGWWVSGAGDLNADGIADLVIGAALASPGGRYQAGASYVVFGSPALGSQGVLELSSLSGVNGLAINGVTAQDQSGYAVSSAGDFNADGIGDLLIGAANASPPGGRGSAGASYVLFGRIFSPFVRNSLTIQQGEGVVLTTLLSVTPDTNLSTFTVCDLSYGQFEMPLFNPPGQAITSFTGNQLHAREIVFVTEGGTQAPSYTIQVEKLGTVFQSTADIDFTPLATAHSRAAIELSTVTRCEGIVINGVSPNDWSGFSVSGAGDLNADGIADLLIGANQASPGGRASAGAGYVVFGSRDMGGNDTLELFSLNGVNGFVLNGVSAGDQSGRSVSDAGDLNADGIADLVIGAICVSPGGRYQAGASYVVFGSHSIGGNGTLELSSLNGTNGFVLNGVAAGDLTGIISSAGDLNADGIADLVIGALYARSYAGATYVVFGHQGVGGNGTLELSSLNGVNGFEIYGVSAHDNSGSSTNVGDFNADGIADLVIGAGGASPGGRINAGASYVVFGSHSIGGNGTFELSNLNGVNGFVLNGVSSGDQSEWVGDAGDLNADGIDDLVIGSVGASPEGKTRAGASYVVFGHREIGGNGTLELSSLNGVNGFALWGVNPGDGSGFSANGAGDVNADGVADLLIGTRFASPGGKTHAGASYVVFGHRQMGGNGVLELSSLNGTDGFVLNGAAAGDGGNSYGGPVSGVGDMNGDGLADMVMGAYGASPEGRTQAGRSYLLWGRKTEDSFDSLQLLTNRFPMISGQTLVLSAQYLNVGVVCDSSDSIVYQVSNLTYGYFALTAAPGAPITLFNQTQINQNQVQFVQDGSPSLPSFILNISSPRDTMTVPGFVHFNARPDIVNNRLPVNQGQLMPILPAYLWATDRETPADWLLYTVSNVHDGEFQWQGDSSGGVTSFTGQNISDGALFFQHDGSTLLPGYTMTVTDGVNIYMTEGVVNFDLLPTLINNQLAVNQGRSTTLTSAMLSAQSPQYPAGQLRFLVSNVTQGQFQQVASNGSVIETDLTDFLQQAVADQHIQFVHDGAPQAPSYHVAVTDGQATVPIPAQAALISFNHAPVLQLNPLVIDQGRPTVIRSQDLSATDVETPAVNLVFQVSQVSGGYFEYAATLGVAITEFLQLSVQISSVQFSNNGSEAMPAFAISVSDTGIGTAPPITVGPQAAQITFNHQPLVKAGKTLANQTVVNSQQFDFTIDTDIFSDPDNHTLTFSAQLSDGQPLPDTLSFDGVDQFSGTLQGFSELNITVSAADPRGLTTNSSFIINVLPQKSTLFNLILTPTVAVSVLTALVGYLYRRWRMWDHRQLNKFADQLRLALNIDVYDFSNEEGADYLRKLDHLIVKLNENHAGFYKKLTPQETKVFAGDVADVLRKYPGMIKPAPWYIKGFNCISCYGRGVKLLDITAFGYETNNIARGAVAAYQHRKNLMSIESGAVEVEMEVLQDAKLVKEEKGLRTQAWGKTQAIKQESSVEERLSLLENQVERQVERIAPLEKQVVIMGTHFNLFKTSSAEIPRQSDVDLKIRSSLPDLPSQDLSPIGSPKRSHSGSSLLASDSPLTRESAKRDRDPEGQRSQRAPLSFGGSECQS